VSNPTPGRLPPYTEFASNTCLEVSSDPEDLETPPSSPLYQGLQGH